MESAADGGYIREGFNLMCVGLNCYGCNLLNTFLCKKGECIFHNNILNKLFLQVPLIAVLVKVLFPIALIVDISAGVAITIHLTSAVTTIQLTREKIHSLGLELPRGFPYGFQTGLHQVKGFLIYEGWYSVFCPVFMELVHTNVFLIAEDFAERTLTKPCTL